MATASVPLSVIVPLAVTGPPEVVKPVVPPDTSTEVTVPPPPIPAHVPSPRKYVELSAVPVARRAVGTVPEARLLAFKLLDEVNRVADEGIVVPFNVALAAVRVEKAPVLGVVAPIAVLSIVPALMSAVSALKLSMLAVPSIYKSLYCSELVPRSMVLFCAGVTAVLVTTIS